MPRPASDEVQAQQDSAIKIFRQWQQATVATLDTETTGLEGRVWQFALVDSRTFTPLLAFNCDPGGEWSDKAAEMRDAQQVGVGDFPTSNLFADVVRGNLESHPPVIWNADFDHAALERTWPGSTSGVPVLCAMRAYAPLYGEWSERRDTWKGCSLQTALDLEHVDTRHVPAAHSAYGDACRLALLIETVAARETQAEREHREDIEALEARRDQGLLETPL